MKTKQYVEILIVLWIKWVGWWKQNTETLKLSVQLCPVETDFK